MSEKGKIVGSFVRLLKQIGRSAQRDSLLCSVLRSPTHLLSGRLNGSSRLVQFDLLLCTERDSPRIVFVCFSFVRCAFFFSFHLELFRVHFLLESSVFYHHGGFTFV